MSLTGLLDAMRGKQAAKAQSAEEAFRALARDLADGKSVKPEVALGTVEAAKKQPEDVAAAVQAVLDRRAKSARYKTLPALGKQLAEVEAGLVQARAAFDLATRQFQATAAPLEFRLAQLQAEQRQVAAMRDELADSCDHPPLLQRKAAAEAALAEAKRQRQDLHRERDAHFKLNPDSQPNHRVAPLSSMGLDRPLMDAHEMAAHRHRLAKQPEERPYTKAQWLAEEAELESRSQKVEAAIRAAERELETIHGLMAEWSA